MFIVAAIAMMIAHASATCNWSPTTASGSHAPAQICSGALIFEDNFDTFDLGKWNHEENADGGGNGEFQVYVNDRANSWTDGGILNIRPTLAIKPDQPYVPNPVRSARIRTKGSFAFKYGKVEIMAKMPAGDWLWPAIWFLPETNVYGNWPASGEIDLVESRGNRNLIQNGVNIGAEQMGSTLHFGPKWPHNGFATSHFTRNLGNVLHLGFHKYQMMWTKDKITFSMNDVEIGTIPAGTGFWDRGGFQNTGLPNPWAGGTVMAPFDQEFHILINLAIGGAFFPDDAQNPGGKPWSSSSPNPMEDFWNGRSQWLPTWNQGTLDSHLMVQYVRVWAL